MECRILLKKVNRLNSVMVLPMHKLGLSSVALPSGALVVYGAFKGMGDLISAAPAIAEELAFLLFILGTVQYVEYGRLSLIIIFCLPVILNLIFTILGSKKLKRYTLISGVNPKYYGETLSK